VHDGRRPPRRRAWAGGGRAVPAVPKSPHSLMIV